MAIQKVPVTSEVMIKAIHDAHGVVKHASKLIGCDDATIFKRALKEPEVAKAIKNARAEREAYNIDDDQVLMSKTRRALHALVEGGNVTAAIFVAKTKCGFEGDGYECGQRVVLNIKQ